MFEQFDEYQVRATGTAAVTQKGRVGRVWSALEFASEMLEASALIVGAITKAQFRPKGKDLDVEKLKDELGDVLWTLSVMAHKLDVPLSEIADRNLKKVGVKHVKSHDVPVVASSGPVSSREAKPKDPFPWVKGSKKAIKQCPSCESQDLHRAEGCATCVKCGWSACS